MTIELIKAIASLWPLALIILLIVCVIVFKGQLRGLIDRLSLVRLKRGSTELEIAGERALVTARPESRRDETPSLEPPAKDVREDLVESLPESPSEWFGQMYKAHQARDMGQLEQAFEKLQEAETNALEKLKYETIYLYWRYDLGDTSALEQLIDLSRRDEVSSEAHLWIGHAYVKAGDFQRAAESYEASAQKVDDVSDRATRVAAAARALFMANKRQEAFSRIELELGRVSDLKAQSTLYQGLAELYKLADNSNLRAVALEKALEAKPNDTALHFEAGYAYSSARFEELALLHYETLLKFDPKNATALNNLGVQYERLKMLGLSAKAYGEAIDLNETLAAANLAYRRMNAGFMGEAQKILEAARNQPKVHPNVGSAIAAIAEKEESESKAQDETLRLARRQQAFLQSFAAAYFVACEPVSFDGGWKSDKGPEFALKWYGERLEAVWIEDSKKFKFEGAVSNKGAVVTFFKMSYGFLSDQEFGFDEDGHGFAFLSPDDQQLFVMKMKEDEASFFTIGRST